MYERVAMNCCVSLIYGFILLGDSISAAETGDALSRTTIRATVTVAGDFVNTGADTCHDVSLIPVTVGPFGNPTVFNVAGDNTSATGPDCDSTGTVPIWWEGFQLDQRARVVVSCCGTELLSTISYPFLFDVCPISGTDCGPWVVRNSSGQGAPVCHDDDENLWLIFGDLKPGTYFIPVRSDGMRGAYKIQIRAADFPVLSTGPDIVTGRVGLFDNVLQLGREGPIGSGTVGLGIATTMCNKGDQTVIVRPLPDINHQVIVANAYRWSQFETVDRFEQIGQSWLKHTFASSNSDDCLFGCDCTEVQCEFDNLPPRCSDSYAAVQFSPCQLGPRSAVHPFTGAMPAGGDLGGGGGCGFNFPASNHVGHDHPGGFAYAGIDHRLQIRDVDLAPELNLGARYYVEGQYITSDEFISGNGNQNNNVAHREIGVIGPDETGAFQFSLLSDTFSESPAIDRWGGARQTIIEPAPLVDGRAILASKVTALGAGAWHYEYAIYNMNMDRAVGAFSLPISAGTEITNVGFHAPLNHEAQPNAETFSNDPWTVDVTENEIRWRTDSFTVNAQANAIRYGTLYNFRFDASAPPRTTGATVGLFKTGENLTVSTLGPIGQVPTISQWGVVVMGLLLIAAARIVLARCCL